jgi:hypothetical protein
MCGESELISEHFRSMFNVMISGLKKKYLSCNILLLIENLLKSYYLLFIAIDLLK